MGNGGGFSSDRPLEWQQEKVFQKETGVQVEVTSAVGRSGRKMLSFSLGAVSQSTGKTSKHVKEIDLDAAIELLQEARQWRDAFRYEEDQAQEERRAGARR